MEKKEEIWLSPMKNPQHQQTCQKEKSDNTKNATKKFDYTAVVDWLRMVSWE